MEQILIRNLPDGTKAELHARAALSRRSMEAEAREILRTALSSTPVSLSGLLAMPNGDTIDFQPERLGLQARAADL